MADLAIDSMYDESRLLGLVSSVTAQGLDSAATIIQRSIIWTSVALAVWQIVFIVRHLIFSGNSPFYQLLPQSRILDIGQPLPEDGKDQLFGDNARDIIEMGYWTLKFLEDFEKEYSKSGVGRSGLNPEDVEDDIAGEDRKDDISSRVYGVDMLYGSNARRIYKMARYLIKFVGTFDKFFKKSKS